MNKCLYCPAEADSLEHVLPAAFGEFRDAPNLDGYICGPCNNERLGRLDEQIARCGPEGLLRKFYDVKGRAEHAKVNPFARGSAGGRRIEFSTFDREFGVKVNLEIENGVVRQMRQLIFVETVSGKTHNLPLREGMTASQVREGMARLGIVEPFETRASFDPHEQELVEGLIKEVCPTVTFSESKPLSNTIETPEAKFELGERYYRAIAKIGFHYFLTQFRKYTGHEEIFSRIRQFIYEDTDKPIEHVNEFIAVRQGSFFQEVLNLDARPEDWRAHFLAAEVRAGTCAAHVQLFMTEDYAGSIYEITLASDSAIDGRESFGHKYLYYPDGKQKRFSGDAKPLKTIIAARTFPPPEPVVARK